MNALFIRIRVSQMMDKTHYIVYVALDTIITRNKANAGRSLSEVNQSPYSILKILVKKKSRCCNNLLIWIGSNQ
jgi:hypothetical protein